MPNWCYNTVNVYGPTESVTRLHNTIRVEGGGWTELFPMPSVLKGTRSPAPRLDNEQRYNSLLADGSINTERHAELVQRLKDDLLKSEMALLLTGFDNWYDWCNAHWETKWGDCETTIEPIMPVTDTISTFTSYFETAWCPFGLTFWATALKDFPDVAVTIWNTEEANMFIGGQCYAQGDLIYDDIDQPEALPDYDEKDPDKYWDALDRYNTSRQEDTEAAMFGAIDEVFGGDATWNNWKSFPAYTQVAL